MRAVVAACLLAVVTALVQPAYAGSPAENGLRAAVESWLAGRTAGLGWETRIRRFQPGPLSGLPEQGLEYEIVAPDQWEGRGPVDLAVVARRNGQVVGNIRVRMDVEAQGNVVVAVRQLDHGTIISAADVTVQKREISAAADRLVKVPADALGKKVRTTIRANQPLQRDHLEKIPLIKAGQPVTIVAESDTIRVTTTGRARGNGAEGDVIMVQSVNSPKEVPARIINATTVQVSF